MSSLHVVLAAADAASGLYLLYLRDLAWTAPKGWPPGGVAADVTGHDREALAAVGRRIEEDLATLEQDVAVLRDAFTTYPDRVNSGVRQPLETQQFSAPQRADALRLPGEYGDFAVKGAVLPMAITAQPTSWGVIRCR